MTGMVCDNNVTTKMKTPIFQTAIQRTWIYCCETSPVSARDEQRMATTYVRMVCWAIGVLLFESLQDSRPRLGAGSISGVELFQVFMGTRLWQDGADQQVFHSLFIPTFARCLSILVESPFLHKGFASSSPYPEAI